MIRWMLVKIPDGDTLMSGGLTDANFHGSTEEPVDYTRRKMTLAKGYLGITADKLQVPLRIRVSRKAWARASPMKEGDILRLFVAKNAENTTATLSGFGTIWVKANG